MRLWPLPALESLVLNAWAGESEFAPFKSTILTKLELYSPDLKIIRDGCSVLGGVPKVRRQTSVDRVSVLVSITNSVCLQLRSLCLDDCADLAVLASEGEDWQFQSKLTNLDVLRLIECSLDMVIGIAYIC